MKKTGIVLSGGGARGFGHLGILKALHEKGIFPNIFSGTSAGALLGAFLAAGYDLDKITRIAKKTDFFNLRHLQFGKAGFFSMTAFENLIEEHIPGNNFDALKHPLFIAATDIIKGETVYFSSGVLSKAVMASSCIPMVYEPIKHNDTYFLDGGLLNNFPVEPLLHNCDMLIGSYVNNISTKLEHLHMKDMLDRSFHLALSQTIRSKAEKCDLYIAPPDMSQFGMFDTDKVDEIISYTYSYTIDFLNTKI